ncbi:hypothetical protein COLO4_33319 [Corchorus olitorius]|uniref:Uncharacterized protein n=1 Tax=Corchorus olitorius TaxID=93759 RepID=A0A1R3GUU1_9ROSI|nr:hypothetical protein COLO4_33319 [Corchorus olitorius]
MDPSLALCNLSHHSKTFAQSGDQDGAPPAELSPVPDEVDDAELAGKSSQPQQINDVCVEILCSILFCLNIIVCCLMLLHSVEDLLCPITDHANWLAVMIL